MTKRKIHFDSKYRAIKRHTLTFYCELFNATLSGCNMSCDFCSASMYKENKTRVINIKDEEYDIYIGKGTKWGNNFREGVDGTREECVAKYSTDIRNKPWLLHAIGREIKGRILGCHCKPLPCHGDVLVELAEGGN